MDVKYYEKMFSDSKIAMTLTDAIRLVRHIRMKECRTNYNLKHWRSGFDVYLKQKFVYAACQEFERELKNSPPWEDYREVLARLEWPYMDRVVSHIKNNSYNGAYGEKRIEADAWFVEMWTAYHILFMRMPGFTPENEFWESYDRVLKCARNITKNYRRKL